MKLSQHPKPTVLAQHLVAKYPLKIPISGTTSWILQEHTERANSALKSLQCPLCRSMPQSSNQRAERKSNHRTSILNCHHYHTRRYSLLLSNRIVNSCVNTAWLLPAFIFSLVPDYFWLYANIFLHKYAGHVLYRITLLQLWDRSAGRDGLHTEGKYSPAGSRPQGSRVPAAVQHPDPPPSFLAKLSPASWLYQAVFPLDEWNESVWPPTHTPWQTCTPHTTAPTQARKLACTF